MTTTDCGVTAAPTTAVPRARSRPEAPRLRPLATATYESLDIPGLEPPPPRRSASLVYVLPVLAALLAAAWAFAWAGAGSSGLPLVPAGVRGELWSGWSHQLSGGGSSSYPVARVVEAGAFDAAVSAGESTWGVGVGVAVLALLYAAGAVAYLARRFVRPLPAALAGVAAVANPYVLSSLPDPQRLVVIGLGASLGGLVWAAADGRRPRPLTLLIASLPVLLLSASPVVVAALAAWALLCALSAMAAGAWTAVRRLVLTALWAVPLLVLAHLWWLLPAASTLGRSREGVELAPDALRSDARATLLALAVPAAAVAGALLVDRLWLRSEHATRAWRSRGLALLSVGATAGLLALPFLAADPPQPTPGLPQPGTTLAAVVNASPVEGKAVLLPATRADTRWSDLVERPIVGRRPGGLFREPKALDAQVRRLRTDLRRGHTAAAAEVLDRLGASHLLVGSDRAARLRGWRSVGRFGELGLYERVRSAPLVRALPAGRAGIVPRARWVRHDPAHYSVRVEGADGPFALALAESFGPGWRLDVPPDWSARHRLADGYANGWLVHGRGSATVQLRYRSPAPAQIAGAISVAAAATVLALTLLTAFYRRLQPERGRGPAPEGTRPRGCGDAHLT